MTAIIIISSIISIFLLLLLLIANTINTKLDYIFNNDYEEENLDNKHDNPEFKAGVNHGFSLIQICLYKMYSDLSILDFDSLNDDIKANLLDLTKSPENFQNWQNKYINYLKSKEEESGENNDN